MYSKLLILLRNKSQFIKRSGKTVIALKMMYITKYINLFIVVARQSLFWRYNKNTCEQWTYIVHKSCSQVEFLEGSNYLLVSLFSYFLVNVHYHSHWYHDIFNVWKDRKYDILISMPRNNKNFQMFNYEFFLNFLIRFSWQPIMPFNTNQYILYFTHWSSD